MRCNANHRHCATFWKPETTKTVNSSKACVCLYRALKLLTDGQVTSQRFNSKHILLSCVIQDLIRQNVWQITIALNQKVSITVAITHNCAINHIHLTHKKILDSHEKNTGTVDEMKKH